MIQIIVTIRKEVADQAAATALFEIIKEKLSDRPDVKLTGHCVNHFIEEEPE